MVSADLLNRIASTLEAPENVDTPALQDLYRQCYGENCRRRPRMLYRLQSFYDKQAAAAPAEVTAALTLPQTMAASENFRFKAGFKNKKAIVHTPVTRFVTSQNLTDADVPTLQAHGLGHFVEVIPGREKEAEAALKGAEQNPSDAAENPDTAVTAESAEPAQAKLPSLNVNKAELQDIYRHELGKEPTDDLNVDELKEAIKQHRAK